MKDTASDRALSSYEAKEGELSKSEKLAFLNGWVAAMDYAIERFGGRKK